jgi:hypothetical protein
MRTGSRKESVESRGTTSWNDGLHSLDGGGISDGGITKTPDPSFGTGGSSREGKDAVGKTTWFDPVGSDLTDDFISDCPGGVCPVPWAKTVDVFETPPVIQEDAVNHPSHYVDGGIECIEAIEAQLTNDEYRGYLKGNIAKYVWRERMKGSTESLKKAQWYLGRLIQLDEAQNG